MAGQFAVELAGLQEFDVGAGGHDPAGVEDDDLLSGTHRG